jgi:outer membrane protein OmpA-like peptidoglycan-associated protein
MRVMLIRTFMTAATVLMAAWTTALAQSSQDGQSVRDILNRAQTQQERKAVEDLIGKLRTNTPRPAPQAAPQAPAVAAEPQSARPAADQPPAVAPAAAAPAAPQSAPATVAQPEPATQPVAAPPVAAASSDSQQPAAPQATEGQPAAPAIGAAGVAAGPAASSAPAAAAPSAAAPVAATPVSAPTSRSGRDARRASRPATAAPSAAANDTAPVGSPIGPAPGVAIAPSDADMARAPEVAKEMGLPTVDIEVLFAYDSHEISPAAAESLMSLGQALADPRLAGQKFVIAGHTDAKGTASYNLGLSDRRAQSVRVFLVEHFKIAPENLVARGFGESRLKNPRNPLGPENRRVQVINWTGQIVEQKRR